MPPLREPAFTNIILSLPLLCIKMILCIKKGSLLQPLADTRETATFGTSTLEQEFHIWCELMQMSFVLTHSTHLFTKNTATALSLIQCQSVRTLQGLNQPHCPPLTEARGATDKLSHDAAYFMTTVKSDYKMMHLKHLTQIQQSKSQQNVSRGIYSYSTGFCFTKNFIYW